MSVPSRLATSLALALLLAGCGDDPSSGFSATAPTGITGASQSTGTTADTGATDDPTATPTTTGPSTTSDSASTTPPCAELTLCPDVATDDPTTPPDTGDPTTLPATDTSDSDDTNDTNGVPGDPCNGAGDGSYCGTALGGLADHNSLYHCSGGTTMSAEPCPAGCENNACKQVAQDPCASAMSGNGKYCGGTLMGGDPGALYNCQNGGTADKQTCNGGCKVNPPGIADACNPEGDPCSGAASGDGPYCGAGLPTGDPNVLYQCVGKATKSSQTCAEGCQQNPPGVPDECKKVQNGGERLDTPPGVLTQSFSACGGGGSHYGIDYGTAVGTPIYAGMAGTVVSSALGYPNCYNNGCNADCWNAFNFVKLKADCGDPDNAANDLFIYYLHINNLAPGVANGTHLDQGQLVANSGNSGCSSGPHIHIETASVPKGQNATLNTCASVNPSDRYCG